MTDTDPGHHSSENLDNPHRRLVLGGLAAAAGAAALGAAAPTSAKTRKPRPSIWPNIWPYCLLFRKTSRRQR